LRIDSVTLENYRSFYGVNEIKLPYYPKDLCIITGSCGSGKTNLTKAIPWLLREPDEKAALIDGDRVPNADALKDAKGQPITVRVSLLLDYPQWGTIRIKKMVDYSANNPTTGNSANIFVEPVNKERERTPQLFIEDLFPNNYSRLHILDGESITDQVTDSTNRRNLMRDMMNSLAPQSQKSSRAAKGLLLEAASGIFNHLSERYPDLRLVASRHGFDIRLGDLSMDPNVLSAGDRILLGYSLYLGFWTMSKSKSPVILDDPFSRLSEMSISVLGEEFSRLSATRQIIILSHPARLLGLPSKGTILNLDQ